MAEIEADVATGLPRKRTFKKFSYRGVDLDSLLDLNMDELVKLFNARPRRRFFPNSFSIILFIVQLTVSNSLFTCKMYIFHY